MAIDRKGAMSRHQNKLSNITGNDVSRRYSYILTGNDLLNAYLNSKKDLNYALRKEVKRDRFVLNSKGLQKELEELCKKALDSASQGFSQVIAADTVNEVAKQLNGLVQLSNGKVVFSGSKVGASNSGRNSAAAQMTKAFTQGVMSGLSGIVEDILDLDED